MTIGQLAKSADTNPQTMRFYEREGSCQSRRGVWDTFSANTPRPISELFTRLHREHTGRTGFELPQLQEDPHGGAIEADYDDVRQLIQAEEAEVFEQLPEPTRFSR